MWLAHARLVRLPWGPSVPPPVVPRAPAAYMGAACETVRCPASSAWFDDPYGLTMPGTHAVTTCSNRGTCRSASTGATYVIPSPLALRASPAASCSAGSRTSSIFAGPR
jgi:hypothetical protein